MPLYEYRCVKCSNVFTMRQEYGADMVAVCPKCGAGADRLMSTGFVFKMTES